MRTIGVITVARSDYGIYLPLLKRIKKQRDLELYIIAAGMHLSPEFGYTASTVRGASPPVGAETESNNWKYLRLEFRFIQI